MGTLVPLSSSAPSKGGDDTLWAVVATTGRKSVIADIHGNRAAALNDLGWREQMLRAYANMLKRAGQPIPVLSLKPIRRTDLPRSWRPVPALGFLNHSIG